MYDHPIKWQSMHQSKAPYIEQFQDRKFGMFIHFGLYALLAGEYQSRRIEDGRKPHVAEWIMHAFNIPRHIYRQLADTFDPSQFDANAIAQLAKRAGMRYIVITSKHHDGFSLYDSRVSNYNIMQTPYGKDLIKDLHQACKCHGLAFGLYYSHSIDWADGGDGGLRDYKNSENRVLGLHAYNEYDPHPQSYDTYIQNKALPQVKEILNQFPSLSNIWFDVAYYIPEKYSYLFYQTVYDIQPQALVSERVGNGYGDIVCPGDNKIPDNAQDIDRAWETVGTMNNSWGYKHYDQDWKSSQEVLFWLIEIVSKGGNYMLNIGPDGQGRVPQQNIDILTDIGQWLDMNGEAVYSTRRWLITHEGSTHFTAHGTEDREAHGFTVQPQADDIWFTCRDNTIYCISLCPEPLNQVHIRSLKGFSIESIERLEDHIPLQWESTANGITVQLPKERSSELGFALRIQVKDEIEGAE